MKLGLIVQIKHDYPTSITNWPRHVNYNGPFLFLKDTKKHTMYIHHFHGSVSFFNIIEKIN